MALRLPPAHALSAFEAVARHASFALAAEELCITASALSHRIRLLEEFVGERLFARDARAVTLTEFGHRYLEVVSEALQKLIEFPLPNRTLAPQQRVKVSVPPTFAHYLFVPYLAEFTRLHPEIVLETFLSVPLYDMTVSESDVEVRFGAGQYPNLVTEKLFLEPAFPVASRDYLAQVGELKTPADLQRVTLLRSALEPWQPWFKVAGLDLPEPSTGLRLDDLGMLLEAIRHGHGVGLTRQHFAQKWIEKGDIVKLFDIHLDVPPHAYYIVYERQARLRPEVNTFITWMLTTFTKL